MRSLSCRNAMQIEDLIKRVAAEPERTVKRTAWTTPTSVLARQARPGGPTVTEVSA